jgi:hypothetical protein
MTKIAVVFIGMGLVSVPFATYSHAEMKSGNLPDATRMVGRRRAAWRRQ